MKKLLSLVLALALLCACVPAFADPYENNNVSAPSGDTYVNPDSTTVIATPIPDGFNVTGVKVFKVNMPANAVQAVVTDTVNVEEGVANVSIGALGMISDGSRDDCEQKYVIEFEDATDAANPKYYYVNYYINAQGNGVVLASFDNYYQGHANAFGPKVDGSWKTYAAVDLSIQGVQTCKLIASGGWYLGTVNVAVNGDEVVVDYLMAEDIITTDVHDDLFVKGEYLNIFGDAASIDMAAESAFEFGKPISIANDLAGDTTVCVFVDLETAYNVSCPFVTRFWPNMRENKAIVEAMNAILAD